jgi:hypothetical protein
MSKTRTIKKFNKMIDNFLSELHTILPNEKDIVIFQSQLSVATMLNEKKILNSFVEFVYPYKNHILEKNEDFFMSDTIDVDKDYLSDSIHLKELWKTKLSDENKEVVWKYFQVMVLLSEKCV